MSKKKLLIIFYKMGAEKEKILFQLLQANSKYENETKDQVH